jgi:hypothetical protein
MKRKAAQSKQSLAARAAESPSALQTPDQGFLYKEATGKTVDFIRYVEQSTGLPAFEIRFTDSTFLFIEPVPRIEFRVRLLKADRGNIKTIRNYRTVR